MAGRGRGAGRGMSLNIESLGFGRGEALPGPILQPPPLFPPLDLKPVPLLSGEEFDYLLALKQEYRGTMRESPYFMKHADKRKDIARYSDKYAVGQQENHTNWEPDWSRLPGELRRKIRPRLRVRAIIKPKIAITPKEKTAQTAVDVTKTLEELEKKEVQENADDEEEDEEKEGEELEDEDYYDEEDIDDTDYNQTYFDNGENYGHDEDDDLDEGPIY